MGASECQEEKCRRASESSSGSGSRRSSVSCYGDGVDCSRGCLESAISDITEATNMNENCNRASTTCNVYADEHMDVDEQSNLYQTTIETRLEMSAHDTMDVDMEVAQEVKRYPQGSSPFEQLPTELLRQITQHLRLDIPPGGFGKRNIDLCHLAKVSQTLRTAALSIIYEQVTIPHSKIFRKFLAQITANPELGLLVRRLDFSHFNPQGQFISAAEREAAQNLTSETLLQCLRLIPKLQEFLCRNNMEEELSSEVVGQLLKMPQLQALDFSKCGSAALKQQLQQVTLLQPTSDESFTKSSIRRLSLHQCHSLSRDSVASLLGGLTQVTHLDLARSSISFKQLMSIPNTARITHLNLTQCTKLSAPEIARFLATHPAVMSSLVWVDLSTRFDPNAAPGSIEQDEDDEEVDHVTETAMIIASLPMTVESLFLRGRDMRPCHIGQLRGHGLKLVELGLGTGLTVDDLKPLFLSKPKGQLAGGKDGQFDFSKAWEACQYVLDDNEVDPLDMSGCPCPHSHWLNHGIKYLDLSDMNPDELADVQITQYSIHDRAESASTVTTVTAWGVGGTRTSNGLLSPTAGSIRTDKPPRPSTETPKNLIVQDSVPSLSLLHTTIDAIEIRPCIAEDWSLHSRLPVYIDGDDKKWYLCNSHARWRLAWRPIAWSSNEDQQPQQEQSRVRQHFHPLHRRGTKSTIQPWLLQDPAAILKERSGRLGFKKIPMAKVQRLGGVYARYMYG